MFEAIMLSVFASMLVLLFGAAFFLALPEEMRPNADRCDREDNPESTDVPKMPDWTVE